MSAWLEGIGAMYPLSKQSGSERQFKASGMKFDTVAYTAQGFGHVGVMNAAGMAGMMKMETLILNPFSVDAPIFSYDRIHAMGKDILVCEMYDSLIGKSFKNDQMKAAAQKCPNVPKDKSYWYDNLIIAPSLNMKGKKKDSVQFDQLFGEVLKAYLAAASASEQCDPAVKRDKARVYSEGLLEHGGPATDPVKKSMGASWTENLFREVLFGTGA